MWAIYILHTYCVNEYITNTGKVCFVIFSIFWLIFTWPTLAEKSSFILLLLISYIFHVTWSITVMHQGWYSWNSKRLVSLKQYFPKWNPQIFGEKIHRTILSKKEKLVPSVSAKNGWHMSIFMLFLDKHQCR